MLIQKQKLTEVKFSLPKHFLFFFFPLFVHTVTQELKTRVTHTDTTTVQLAVESAVYRGRIDHDEAEEPESAGEDRLV